MSEFQWFVKKPIPVKAAQWFKNGDHPEDNAWETFDYPDEKGQVFTRPKVIREGAVVRYYRTPEMDGEHFCKHCNQSMKVHGWIDTLEGGHIVCPSDWIMTGVEGERYPIKDTIFKRTYMKVDVPVAEQDEGHAKPYLTPSSKV